MERKVYFACFIGILFYLPGFSQAPQSFKYQSVARNINGEPLANTTIGLRINIRNLTETGAILYQETHSVSTNTLGLFSISVGGGNVVNGNFAAVDWGSGAKFIDVEVDFTGGSNYTSMGASQLLSVPYALYAENGKSAKNGLNILNGSTNPLPSLGVDGEFYINTSTQTIFGPKTSGTWPAGIPLVGPSGTAGTNGANGLNVLNGSSDPTSGIGANGEFYINTSSNKIFGPKTSGAWPAGIILVGPTGAAGVNGTNGTNGINGLNVLNGISDPTSGIGGNGEFYINTSSNKIFGPKTSGVWPAGVSLVGPAGPSANAWGLSGNSGTIDGTNFIGTVDDVPLNLKINNKRAGRVSSTGSEVFLGYRAGEVNSGADNVGLGYLALPVNSTGYRNTSVGSQSMISNTTGNGNSSYGYASLFTNTSGYGNTAIGGASMYQNGTGFLNTAVGQGSLWMNTSGAYNSALGYFSLGLNSIGLFNSAFGSNSLGSNTTGNNNTSIGEYSLYSNSTGNNNTAIGFQAGYTLNSANANTTGSNNTFIGYNSGPGTSTQLTNATAVGYQAVVSTNNSLVLGGTGADAVKVGIGVSSPAATLDVLGNIKIKDGTQGLGRVLTSDANGVASWTSPGSSSDWGLTGNAGTVDGTNFIGTTDNIPLSFRVNGQKAGRVEPGGSVFWGHQAGNSNTASDAVGIGTNSLSLNSTGNFNTAVGTNSLMNNTTGFGNSSLGINALTSNTIGRWNTAVGSKTLENNTADSNTAIGALSLKSNSSGVNNAALGFNALGSNTTGIDNTAVGTGSMTFNISGSSNSAFGYSTLQSNQSGRDNVAIGYGALLMQTSGDQNIAVGTSSLAFSNGGSQNTSIGFESQMENTGATGNTSFGFRSLRGTALGSGKENTAIGSQALYGILNGNHNTALGFNAGYTANPVNANVNGSNNTFIGYNSGPGTSTQLTNATAIGYNALVSSNNSLVLGGTGADAVKVGIGVTSPAAALDVLGNIKIADGTQGTGKVLTSDANGIASWTSPSSGSGWGLTGNAGTVDGTNFIGTTDNVPISFRVWNQPAGKIQDGNVFIGVLSGQNNAALANVGIGTAALSGNTSGYGNTAVGHGTLQLNTTGFHNIAIGINGLYSNTTGTMNTAIGSFSLMYNDIGYGNTSLGTSALHFNTSGVYNNAVGAQALEKNTTGTNNDAHGYYSLESNTTGIGNVGFGSQSLSSNTTGSYNTALGFNAFSTGATFSNSTAIGSNAQVTASNMIRLGDANVTSINGPVGFTVVSDKRFKKDISENVSGLPFIMKLRPVTYHMDMNEMAKFLNTPSDRRIKESEEMKEKVLQTGFIAQEVEKAAQDLGYDFSGVDKPDGKDDFYGLRYSEFTVPLVKAVQEQQSMIDALKKEVVLLKELLAQSQLNQEKIESENNALKGTIEDRLKKLEETVSVAAKK